MDKKDIFSLYVGKCKVRTSADPEYKESGIYETTGISITHNVVYLKNYYSLTGRDISDCQLILKRMSNMSDAERKEYEATKVFLPVPAHPMYVKGMSVNSFLWLINNGYALDDNWFDTGLAVEG